MCGIAGAINISSAKSQAEKMIRKISHRGPDHTGVWSHNGIALAHARLSIIELSSLGNQPFEKHQFVLSFNGEIYNYKSLQKELTAYGVNFNSDSDTEVILEGWRYWGINVLNKLRGMFAFAIHDRKTSETFICRDHFGIKPLFYLAKANTFYFASELKAIETVSPSLDVDYSAVLSSLLYVWIPESKCIWKQVKKLTPGHYLKINKNSEYTEHSYWKSAEELTHLPIFEGDAVDYLETVLYSSVKSHLVSDVPVNAFLSGGLDSSLIVAMATKELGPLDCYTIKFGKRDQDFEAMVDDVHYARIVAQHFNCQLHEIEVQPDISELLPEIVHFLDEPIGDAAAINTYLICDAARQQGVKVLLSGMGADELFGGYRKHYANIIAKRYRRIPKFLRQFGIEPLVKALPVASKKRGFRICRWAKRFIKFAGLPDEQAFHQSYTYYNQVELSSLVSPDLMEYFPALREEHQNLFYAGFADDFINQMCLTDVNLFMTSLNLTYSDRASMAASIEVRVPFVDKEVVKAAFQLQGSHKIKGKQGKYILKKVAENWLPKEIIYRPKSSFGMPLSAWIRSDLKEMVDDYVLSQQGLAGRGFLDKKELQNIIESDRKGLQDYAQKIWHLLTLEQWFRNHAV